MTTYLLLKAVHVVCVAISGFGFILRGVWMMRSSSLLRVPWVRVAPHVVDTLLLASAVALMVHTGQYPWVAAWVGAKIAGLVAYVVLGTMALHRGRTREQRAAFWIAALLAFGYIVSVALVRTPLGVLALL